MGHVLEVQELGAGQLDELVEVVEDRVLGVRTAHFGKSSLRDKKIVSLKTLGKVNSIIKALKSITIQKFKKKKTVPNSGSRW